MAFDFDETVEVSKESCRLLLVRLKIDGYAIGREKIFLKYYNEEFMSRSVWMRFCSAAKLLRG